MTTNDTIDELARQAIKDDRADQDRGAQLDRAEIDILLADIRGTIERARSPDHEGHEGALADCAADIEAVRELLAADQDYLTVEPTDCVLCDESSDTPEDHHKHMRDVHDL